MTLKEKLEAVWRDHRIACPSHLVRWTLKPLGWKYTIHHLFSEYHLYYSRGKLTFPKYFRPNKEERKAFYRRVRESVKKIGYNGTERH